MIRRRDPQCSGAFRYSAQDADAYGSLGIAGTTSEIGFAALAEILGDLTGKTWLDFGAGAGRSSLFLRSLGAAFVLGVDHNFTMVKQAKSRQVPGVAYVVIGQTLPIANESMDGAVSCNVYMEMPTREDMVVANAEIYRALKPSSWFVVMSANPQAVGYQFKNFTRRRSGEDLSSGAPVHCIIKTSEGVVELNDFYWTFEDYQGALESVGFAVREVVKPISSSDLFTGTNESIISPYLIMACFKE